MKRRKIRRRCECGCGDITNYGRRYVRGHNNSIASEEIRKKMSISQIGNTHLLGYKHTKKRKLKKSLEMIGNTYAKGHKHSKETRDKMSIAGEGRIFSDEHKRKISNALRNNWQDPEYQKMQYEAQNIRPNKPESILLNLLNKLFPKEYKYIGDFSFMINGKSPDFVNVNGQKKIIELYGDYWHRNDNPQDRIDVFTPFGYKTLIIWENELKKNRLNLRSKLKEFHTK